MDVNLKKILYNINGKDFPISGGLGLDMDTRVVISETYHTFALSIVNEISNTLIEIFKIDTITHKQTAMVEVNSYKLARVTITFAYEVNDGDEMIENLELFFDLSLSHKNIGRSLQEVKSKEEIDLMVADYYKKPEATRLLPHFADIVSTSITYGSTNLGEADFIQLFDICERDAERAMNLLDECGLLDKSVHEYYQCYFGHIYPEGYWEILW